MSRQYVQPGFFMAHVINPIVRSLGAPTVTVNGRRSGMPISTPVNPFDFEGARYLVGGGGNTHWVRNLRVAGAGSLRVHGRDQDFRAVELEGADQVRIASAYRDHMGRRAASYFAVLPNPADHPVFRLEPAA
ncbi:MAG TPA: nitroreductase/quinone reductase family protein [Candidatus Dormibacteraeota bacterium]|nr:nitroreductase/quinone reductase family protein [Candidatus Dormibacteraeota bacterium]